MEIKRKWMAIAGAVLVVGALGSGAGLAAGGSTGNTAPGAHWIDSAVKAGKLTQAQADVMQQLVNQKRAAMTKLKADQKAAIDQAVKAGKLTQAEADQLLQRLERKGHHGPGQGKFGRMGGMEGQPPQPMPSTPG